MSLTVRDLAVSRGGLPLLHGVSFEVAAGEALVLRGPNGSGKTTLLRTLAGLQPADAGLARPGADAIAYASHADGLKPTLTVAENLGFWASVFGTGEIGHAVAAFDLGALRARPAANLSAGQKRRLGLARLLVTGRPVWLLDEPTVSLDTKATAAFVEVIRAHLARGGTAVIATHIELGLDAPVFDVGAHAAPLEARPADAFDGDWS
jgi:heme exporter protein A